MAFKIEITPRNDPTEATAYAVIVTIDDHETVLSFESKEAARVSLRPNAQGSQRTSKKRKAPHQRERGVRCDGIAADVIGASGSVCPACALNRG